MDGNAGDPQATLHICNTCIYDTFYEQTLFRPDSRNYSDDSNQSHPEQVFAPENDR